MLPLVELVNSPVQTITQFYTALEQAFGDPNREATAQKEIQKLKQANRSFHVYLSEFESIIPYTGYDERNARYQFKQGLCSELKASLVPVDEDSLSFRDLKKVYQRMDNKNRELPTFQARNRPIEPSRPANTSVPRAPITVINVNRSTNDGNTAIDLSSASTRSSTPRGPLAPIKRQRRIDNNLYLYRGYLGHIARDYPIKKASEERKVMLRTAALEAPAPVAPSTNTGNA